jgi:hypothetical protein
LNGAGVAQATQVGTGEPSGQDLIKILKAGGYQIVLHDRGVTHDMTRFEMHTFAVADPDPTLIATIDAEAGTITFTGSVVANQNVHTFVGWPLRDAYVQTAGGDSTSTVATKVANAIVALDQAGLSASAAGNVVTLTGSPAYFCNITGPGLVMATEIGRRRHSIQATCWCPSVAVRYAVHDAIESQVGTQLQTWLAMSDGTPMQIEASAASTAKMTLSDQQSVPYAAWVAYLCFDIEYAVLSYTAGGEVASVEATVAIGPNSATVLSGGS